MSQSQQHTGLSAHGDKLLTQLRAGWAPLPARTLFAMAVGGLRVRLMRSTVTMLSIVLAIAFLTYTGLTNKLNFNLAVDVRALEDFTPVAPQRTESAAGQAEKVEVFTSIPVDRQRQLAIEFKMHDVEKLKLNLPNVEQELRTAELTHAATLAEHDKLRANKQAPAADLADVRARLAAAEAKLKAAQVRTGEARDQVALGDWLRSGGATGDQAMHAMLLQTLNQQFRKIMGTVKRPARLTDEQLPIAVAMVKVYREHPSASADAAAVIEQTLADEKRKRQATELKNMLRRAAINIETTLAGNPMDTWLITMAMLTCAVGIANAMLMSVTERFREIGTMKCLGAQDNLVVKLFLLESGVLGIIGAAIGIVLGFLVAILGAVLQFGFHGLSKFPAVDSLGVVAMSVLGGIILSVVGAVYPAFAASRMKPVDALRVDE